MKLRPGECYFNARSHLHPTIGQLLSLSCPTLFCLFAPNLQEYLQFTWADPLRALRHLHESPGKPTPSSPQGWIFSCIQFLQFITAAMAICQQEETEWL